MAGTSSYMLIHRSLHEEKDTHKNQVWERVFIYQKLDPA
eukprot:CAMPEP_0194411848 /NCGR_PEP_ID=MMETSP0176-20130528/10148_1 /TAXON_ID=216777 /ORGANISM="Proboscia alata, Strain PI-D3" /LENGTH=38 /DNA_ID= /DNA_START= /DNA_END= /DNA_ORIENTATION=